MQIIKSQYISEHKFVIMKYVVFYNQKRLAIWSKSQNIHLVKANPITLYLLTNFSNELAFNIVFETNSPL